jgi:5-methylcytosine-specific restriction endonuclease McrA
MKDETKSLNSFPINQTNSKKSSHMWGSQANNAGDRNRNDTLHYTQKCTVCQKSGIYTEFHHIITPNQSYQDRNNANNMIELCLSCHNKTTASLSYRHLSGTTDDRCSRCGRTSHQENACYAKTDVRGAVLTMTSEVPTPSETPSLMSSVMQAVWHVFTQDISDDEGDQFMKERRDGLVCFRCGRKGHYANKCFAKKDIYGNVL